MAPGNRKSQGCHPAPSPLRTRGVDRRGGGKELVDPDLRLRSGPLDNYVPVPPSLTSALRIPTGRLVGWRGPDLGRGATTTGQSGFGLTSVIYAFLGTAASLGVCNTGRPYQLALLLTCYNKRVGL